MAKDIGEEIVGAWLRLVRNCDFVQYNVPTRIKQGEIDVVGLNLQTKTVYVCEVATHTGGLQYTKGSQPNNIIKLTQKFRTDIEYAQTYLGDFTHIYMLWSPIVRHPKSDNTIHNVFKDLAQIQKNIHRECGDIKIQMVINEVYQAKIEELKNKTYEITENSEFAVFRLLQIFSSLEKHVQKLKNLGIENSQSAIDNLFNSLPD